MKPQGNKYIMFYKVWFIHSGGWQTLSDGYKTKLLLKRGISKWKKSKQVLKFKILSIHKATWKKLPRGGFNDSRIHRNA